MRVYLPSTMPALRRLSEAGAVGPAPVTAYAVTPRLREWYATGDAEELEYAAFSEAARASLRLLHGDPKAPARRVVLAADVPDDQVSLEPAGERSAICLTAPVSRRLLAAVHVDAAEADRDVRSAAEAIALADLGDSDAQFTVDGAEGHELLWYAAQELADLVD